MPTYSPEQALARPTSRAPLWGEGLLAATLWLLGGLFTLTWPDAGRRWPFSEGWALAQFTLGGGLLLLALSYRYWRARGARVLHAGKWLALLPVLFAVWEGLTAKTAVLPVPFFAPPQALIEVLHDDWPRLLDSLLHSLGLLGLGVLLGTSSGFITGLAIGWSQRLLGASGVTSAGAGALHRAAAAVPVYFSLELRRQRVFDRAEHLVPGHGADLVRSDGH